MIAPDVLLVFTTASVALAISPGPDNIFVLTQSALHGRLAGFAVALGLTTGVLVHATLVALGVAAIFQTSSTAFTLLKLVGSAYLLYLAWRSFRAVPAALVGEKGTRLSFVRLFGLGIVMNLSNPKVAIFFLAFLPQFADPVRGAITVQILLLGAVFASTVLVIFGMIAAAAGALGVWLGRTPTAQIILNRITGVVFVALAVRLLMAER